MALSDSCSNLYVSSVLLILCVLPEIIHGWSYTMRACIKQLCACAGLAQRALYMPTLLLLDTQHCNPSHRSEAHEHGIGLHDYILKVFRKGLAFLRASLLNGPHLYCRRSMPHGACMLGKDDATPNGEDPSMVSDMQCNV